MAHDAFISYSHEDKPTADAICATLEQNGVRCWIAPRDIAPGADWSGAIIQAINGARVFVLVFSQFANTSNQVKREVERAVNRSLPVIPFRIQDVPPSDTLEFFISTPHWLDALTPPIEHHAQLLAASIKGLLGQKEPPPVPPPPAPPPPAPKPRKFTTTQMAAIGAAAAAVVAGGAYMLQPATFNGKWRSTRIDWLPGVAQGFIGTPLGELYGGALNPAQSSGTLEVDRLGTVTSNTVLSDHGTVTLADGELTFQSSNGATSMVSEVLLPPGDANVAANGGKPNEAVLELEGRLAAQKAWLGQPDPQASGPLRGVAGAWRSANWPVLANGQVWSCALTILPNGSYTVALTITSTGTWQAADGKWTVTVRLPGPPGQASDTGPYAFSGRNVVTIKNEFGASQWVRTG